MKQSADGRIGVRDKLLAVRRDIIRIHTVFSHNEVDRVALPLRGQATVKLPQV